MAVKKKCTNCNETKLLKEFNKRKISKDGYNNHCSNCKRRFYRSPRGIASNTRYRQHLLSLKRGYTEPTYTSRELETWMLSQPNFNYLYQQWIDSGYNRLYSVSCDRIDDYKSYSFDNIILTTWQLNKLKSDKDTINGINLKRNMEIACYDKKTGAYIETYYSQAEAERRTGITQPCISSVIRGKTKTAGGFLWRMVKRNGK